MVEIPHIFIIVLDIILIPCYIKDTESFQQEKGAYEMFENQKSEDYMGMISWSRIKIMHDILYHDVVFSHYVLEKEVWTTDTLKGVSFMLHRQNLIASARNSISN